MLFDDLDKKMRSGEYFHQLRVPDDVHTILRLDGRSFSKLTADNFEKPYDVAFNALMSGTAMTLMGELNGIYAYTQSDEISVLLPKGFDLFNRKLEKLVSISAAIATEAFNNVGLNKFTSALFDSRVWFAAASDSVVDYFSWRQADAERNSLNSYCYWKAREQGMSKNQATKYFHKASPEGKRWWLQENYKDFYETPAWTRLGSSVRWAPYIKTGHNPKNGKDTMTIRRELKVDTRLERGDAYRTQIENLVFNQGSNLGEMTELTREFLKGKDYNVEGGTLCIQ